MERKPDGILFVDPLTDRIVSHVSGTETLYGYSPDEFKVLLFKDISQTPANLLLGSEKGQILLQNHLKKDGSRFDVKLSLSDFTMAGNHVLCILIQHWESPGSPRGDDSMAALHDRVINNYSGFIYTVSKDYKIEFMNKTLIEHVGHEIESRDCFALIHGLDQRCPWCVGEEVLAGESASFEYKSPKNNRWYSYVSTPLTGEDRQIVGQQVIAIDIHEQKQKEKALEKREQRLKQENRLLKSAAVNRYGLDEIVGQSLKMQEVYNLILEVASSDASILIYGESGTGKELTARAIHDLGPRKSKSFLPVNCGGIPETLIESEFFGYKKGAFSGAHIDKSGYLEISDRGTLFLDEIGEINLNMQVKLLRAIDGNGFTPLGGHQVIKPEIRIISATNRDLEDLVAKGRMRPDFFYRINVVPIYLPPLRERRDDIPLLIYHFLKKFSSGKSMPHIPAGIMKALEEHRWPGNVRELQNIINRYVAMNRLEVFESFLGRGIGQEIENELAGSDMVNPGRDLQSAMRNYEKKIILRQLEQTRWNQSKAAMRLGVNRKTLYTKIKKLGINDV